jgi:type I restriction enzyme R subunit
MGTYARTTYDQYGELLHAYTTKNAMDDKSVLDFQVEYHSLMNPEEEERVYFGKIKEKYPDVDPMTKLNTMSETEKESLLETKDFENDVYIETMLKKIFRHQSVLEKFKVVNGLPTMSGILTTHSIAQAKRIYHKLMELKKSGSLVTGKPLDEKRRLNDPDFPRVAITYSISENQSDMKKAQEELLEIMREYDAVFGTHYADGAKKSGKNDESGETEIDDSNYNQNINSRLARKGAQYQKDGQWLDLVIVVERLLTGFDAPTIQALYVDKELKWHGLLQAFSRTNRNYSGKNVGMIVTFRKPKTMADNVRDAIKLFSNEARDWENLVPRQYAEVRQEFKTAHKAFTKARMELEQDPNDLKKRLTVIKTYQSMRKLGEAIRSYEEFEEDYGALSSITDTITAETGHIENLKAEVREELENQDVGGDYIDDVLEIEFSADQKATLEEKIDSYYIAQLLKDIRNESSRRKFDEIIKNKTPIVKEAYEKALSGIDDEQEILDSVDRHFRRVIDDIVAETASALRVPDEELRISLNEYSRDKGEVPYINAIISKSTLTKDEFESAFGRKFRERRRVIEEHWKTTIDEKLLPLKDELANFASEFKTILHKKDEV